MVTAGRISPTISLSVFVVCFTCGGGGAGGYNLFVLFNSDNVSSTIWVVAGSWDYWMHGMLQLNLILVLVLLRSVFT